MLTRAKESADHLLNLDPDPRPSQNDGAHDAKKLALSFARAVTVESSNATYWVAGNGDHSIFKALQGLMPEVEFQITCKTKR